MREKYLIKSDRYGYSHRFEQIANDIYAFVPEQDWMPIYITNGGGHIMVDTDGGPCLYNGWSNDEIEVKHIIRNDNDDLTFILKEK